MESQLQGKLRLKQFTNALLKIKVMPSPSSVLP